MMDPGLQTLEEEIDSQVRAMSPQQLHGRPPGKWSAAEILEHLYLTYTGTIKGFERLYQTRQPLASRRNWRQRAGQLIVLDFGYFPSGREAPAVARPRGLPREKVLAEIGSKITEMDSIITQCEQLLGRGRLLDHPILGPLTAAQWRKFHLVHGRHHLKQLRRLTGKS
jgi:hypothetical protein